MQEFIFKNESEAQAACEWWKKQIEGLGDWRLTVHIKRAFEIPDGHTAYSHIIWQNREAIIFLIDPNDYFTEWILDHEQYLLHEMMHCLIDHLISKEGTLEHELFEQFIDGMAWTLLKLRRSAYPEPPWRSK